MFLAWLLAWATAFCVLILITMAFGLFVNLPESIPCTDLILFIFDHEGWVSYHYGGFGRKSFAPLIIQAIFAVGLLVCLMIGLSPFVQPDRPISYVLFFEPKPAPAAPVVAPMGPPAPQPKKRKGHQRTIAEEAAFAQRNHN